jgi:hypothetical protein
VEVAEGGESERWGLAAFSVGFDVSAGGGWHVGSLNLRLGCWLDTPSPRRGYFGSKWNGCNSLAAG